MAGSNKWLIEGGKGAVIAAGIDYLVEQFHIPLLNDMSFLGPSFSNIELLLYGSGLYFALTKKIPLGAGIISGTILYEQVLSAPLRSTVPV